MVLHLALFITFSGEEVTLLLETNSLKPTLTLDLLLKKLFCSLQVCMVYLLACDI